MSSWWTEGKKYWRLSARERRLVAAAVLLLGLTRWSLRWLGWRKTERLASRWVRPRQPAPAGARLHPDRIARLVAHAAALTGAPCLPQALVLVWLLEREGWSGDLRVGVRKDASGLQAHAWVEVAGRVLAPAGDAPERYSPFERSLRVASGGAR